MYMFYDLYNICFIFYLNTTWAERRGRKGQPTVAIEYDFINNLNTIMKWWSMKFL